MTTKSASLLSALTAIGSAHAGEPLTPVALLRRLTPANDSPEEEERAAAFRRKFNGPAPAVVVFPDETTAAAAVDFENKARR